MSDTKQREPTSQERSESANAGSVEPIRSSFSMSRYSREAIRRCAERYGTTQGTVVDLAPALYALVADVSLQRRREALPAIKTAVEQAVRSIESIGSIAPHLQTALKWAVQTVEAILDLEETAIAEREIHGVQKTGYGFSSVLRAYELAEDSGYDSDYERTPDPFLMTLATLINESKSDTVARVSKASYEEIKFRCCEGANERKLREDLGDELADLVIAGVPLEEAKKLLEPIEISVADL